MRRQLSSTLLFGPGPARRYVLASALALGTATAFAPGCGDFEGYRAAQSTQDGGSSDPVRAVDVFEPPVPLGADGRCQSGRKPCDGRCVSTSDPAYGCGVACDACNVPRATAGCSEGLCVVRACSPGLADCRSGAADGCETNLASDRAHCGACGNACTGAQVCSNGACASTCAPGLLSCNSTCVDPATDSANCKACGNACAPNQTCNGGVCACVPSCAGKACGGSDGCGGSCDGPCAAGLRCANKQCVCDAQSCGGCCQNGQCRQGTSNAACGRGGLACLGCSGSSSCAASGVCTAPTPVLAPVCAGQNAVGLSVSCRNICSLAGKACKPGCFPVPSAVAYTTSAQCVDLVSARFDCNEAVPVDNFSNLSCCCG